MNYTESGLMRKNKKELVDIILQEVLVTEETPCDVRELQDANKKLTDELNEAARDMEGIKTAYDDVIADKTELAEIVSAQEKRIKKLNKQLAIATGIAFVALIAVLVVVL